ncbi:zonadhesin-like [Lissotriton helveticus]
MDRRGFIILALTAVLTLVTGDESTKGSCPPNMHYTECGSGCPKTCTDGTGPHHSPRICALSCVSGCVCDDGYVYESLDSKRCVPSSDCKQTCPANSEDVECGTACPLTCDNYRNPPVICTLQCVPGCACKTGYILESATSKNCIRPSECKKTCQDHAHYNECGTACPITCANYEDLVVCTLQCAAGCFCDEGYVLESAASKRCIPQSDCKKTCGGNSSFSECGTACPLTCENYAHPPVCTRECAIGCVCNEGYVLENATSSRCIPKGDCKKTCGTNSSYTDCGTACPLTCDNYDNPPQVCTDQCVAGCFCDEGYVFESATCKRCVPQSDCKNTCVGNSNYTDCGTACPLTCANYKNPNQACTLQCVQGCFCNEGFVLDSAASKCCIPKSDCKYACPDNSRYTECGTACPLTCDNYLNPPLVCTKQCVQGCFCEEGYVFESATSKRCIPQKECEKVCGPNSKYTDCGTACPLTCGNYQNPPLICTYQCVQGCFCEEGYVFESAISKRCIPPTDCGRVCPHHSKYTDCGSACPLTCDNYENPVRACTEQCVRGCFCEEGYVLESATSKRCIPPTHCKKVCLHHSKYTDCGSACPLTCDNYENPVRACTEQCVQGCFCEKGYVLESATSKRCIPQKECEKVCGPNSRYTDCGTACPLTCANYENPPQMCTYQCVRGCFCEEGYVLESTTSKRCIPPTDCKKVCPHHSKYTECGSACPLTCDNYENPVRACTDQCVQGCFCEEGYVLESATSKRCIPPTHCKKVCPHHSKYTDCGSACPLTCDNYENPVRACTDQCVQGCFCEEGYVLENDASNRCVKRSSCTPRCSANAHYQQCGTACPKTCADVTHPVPRPCPLHCMSGCHCDEGYVLENAASNVCVKESQCKSCDANSHYSTCATACPLNCQNFMHPPLICPLICLEGCICNKGYVFQSGQSGPCVPRTECPGGTED